MTARERERWLAERRTLIGASDAAAACGLSRWRTRLHLWAEKALGLAGDFTPDQLADFARRERAEPFIAGEWEERTGVKLVRPAVRLHRHRDHPWLGATPDFLTADGTTTVQTKTADWPDPTDWGPDGSNRFPTEYRLQVQQELAVLGLARGELAVVFGRGWEFRRYPVERDDRLAADLVEVAGSFWAWVRAGVPPPPDWTHPGTAALVARMPGADRPRRVALGEAERAAAEQLRLVRKDIAVLNRQKDRLKGDLLAALGGPGVGDLPGGGAVEWKELTVARRPQPGGTTTRTDLRITLGGDDDGDD